MSDILQGDVFDLDRVERAVRREIPDARVIWMEHTQSTNLEARELARLGGQSWTVAVAGSQSAGRGRHQRSWVSPPGGLYLSVLLRLNRVHSPVTLLPLLAGLALKDAIEENLVRHGGGQFRGWLKWPNDLMTRRGKLAGILCEATKNADQWEIIVGAGLNIVPVDLREAGVAAREVTCLADEHPAVPWRREDLLAGFLLRLKEWLEIWQREPDRVRQAWLEESGVAGRKVEVTNCGRRLEGIAAGIDFDGALLVNAGGVTHTINAAEGLIVRD